MGVREMRLEMGFLPLHTTDSFAHFLELPWSYYQGAEYLFHVSHAEWETCKFVCGWLRGGLAIINSSGEQTFIQNKIRKVRKKYAF